MGILKNLFGGNARDPEKMYGQAMELFGQNKFREAAAILEETVTLNPKSAPAQFSLGVTYSRIAGEYGKDEEDKILPWLKKAADCLQQAISLASTGGGLNQQQLTIARDLAAAVDRVSK